MLDVVLKTNTSTGTLDAEPNDAISSGVPARSDALSGTRTIGLCMIVKNEAHVILGCLASVRPLVDFVLIVDTGSTDGTQDIVRGYLRQEGLRGRVVDEPWQNFAYNRSFSLNELRAEAWIDYAFIIDADDHLELSDGFDPGQFKASMDRDIYDVEIVQGECSYFRPQICRNALPFRFKGVLHEYLDAPPGATSRGVAAGFHVRYNSGGARSRNPRKYEEDAAVFEAALSTETDAFLISRYTFYLAQSYRDCGNKQKALENYLKRADLGYWTEEIYVSLLEAGNLMAALDRPFDEVIAAYQRASDIVPGRAEALHAASRYCREKGRHKEGYELACRGLDLRQPSEALFAQPWVYDYGLLDECAVNAYWAGAYGESLEACLRLLESETTPRPIRRRIAANARFAAEKLREPADLGFFDGEGFVEQHALVPERPLRSYMAEAPRVLLAILVKEARTEWTEAALSLYLDCIEALDYPKSSIVLHIGTNQDTQGTEQILLNWVGQVGHMYAGFEFDSAGVASLTGEALAHEPRVAPCRPLGHIRDISLQRALDHGCDFYFSADTNAFLRRATLRELTALNLPIAAPLLRPALADRYYSNFHAQTDAAGYYKECDQYLWIVKRHVRGLIEVPVIHCAYLIRADAIPMLTYQDGTGRHEYVVFSETARRAQIPQYLDNRQLYGYIGLAQGDLHFDGDIERARALLCNELSTYSTGMQDGTGMQDDHKNVG